jgi:hypothetical protein
VGYSKNLERIAKINREFIASYHYEEDHGHWLYAVKGVIFRAKECGTCRENTVSDVMQVLLSGVQAGDQIIKLRMR